MDTSKLLILKAPEMRSRLDSLFNRIREDTGIRALYLKDPVGTLHHFVFPENEGVLAGEINRGNRVLFSLLSNEQFMKWCAEYERSLLDNARKVTGIEDPWQACNTYLATIDRSTLHQEIVAAVARFADAELVAALTWRPEVPKVGRMTMPHADVTVDVEVFVYAVLAVAVAVAATAAAIVVIPISAPVLSRADLQVVANTLTTELTERAREARRSGVLTDFRQRNDELNR